LEKYKTEKGRDEKRNSFGDWEKETSNRLKKGKPGRKKNPLRQRKDEKKMRERPSKKPITLKNSKKERFKKGEKVGGERLLHRSGQLAGEG